MSGALPTLTLRAAGLRLGCRSAGGRASGQRTLRNSVGWHWGLPPLLQARCRPPARIARSRLPPSTSGHVGARACGAWLRSHAPQVLPFLAAPRPANCPLGLPCVRITHRLGTKLKVSLLPRQALRLRAAAALPAHPPSSCRQLWTGCEPLWLCAQALCSPHIGCQQGSAAAGPTPGSTPAKSGHRAQEAPQRPRSATGRRP